MAEEKSLRLRDLGTEHTDIQVAFWPTPEGCSHPLLCIASSRRRGDDQRGTIALLCDSEGKVQDVVDVRSRDTDLETAIWETLGAAWGILSGSVGAVKAGNR